MNLNYIGYKNKSYLFTDATGKTIYFNKVRSDLVRQFNLMSDTNRLKQFIVRFFVIEKDLISTLIISDLEPL